MISDAFRRFKHRRRLARALSDLATRPQNSGRPHGLPAPLILSLTSYGARFPTLALTLQGLLHQTIRPDRTILWLAAQDNDSLPAEIRAMPGLEIRICPDWRSYKKIIPTLMAYPDAYIATADDDVYYPADWLERLVEAVQGGATVACGRAHRVVMVGDQPAGYEDWTHNLREPETGPLVFPTGVSGVIYAPHVFHPDVTDADRFMAMAPGADDIWLYWMHRMANSTPSKIGKRARIFEWDGSQNVSLRSENRPAQGMGGNDRAIAALLDHYGWPD